MTKPIPFAVLEHFLLERGFTKRVTPHSQLLLEHAASGCVLFFRPYRPQEKVEDIKLASVRLFLDEFGILDQEEFDNLLSASAA
jgi:hypothetical protein